MAVAEYEGGAGGKLQKPPLRGAPSTPYDRSEAAARGLRLPPLAAEVGGSGWLSKIMDPASRVISSSAFRLFSSVFRKRLAALPAPPRENLNTTEELLDVKSTHEVRELGVNAVYGRLPIKNDGSGRSDQEIISCTDGIFELEQWLKQKKFTWAETERLKELLHSRTIEPCTSKSPDNMNTGADSKNKGKVNGQSNVDPSLSQQAINEEEQEKANASELEDQRDKLVKLHDYTEGHKDSHKEIPEEAVGLPIEVARAYMGSKPLKVFSSSLGLHSRIHNEDNALATNVTFGNKLSNVAIASRSSPCFPEIPTDSENDYMTSKLHVRSALCSPYYRSLMITNSRALKRGSSDSDAGCFGHARRVRQKSSVKDMLLSACAYSSSTSHLGQGYREDACLEGTKNIDGSILVASCLPVPSQSTEMARKILHQLDKLVHSPRHKLSEKKVIVGDASSSKSSLNASNGGALNFKGNDDATVLVNAQGKIKTSISPNKDTANEELSLKSSILGTKLATSCFHINGVVASASDAKHVMRSRDSEVHGFALLSTPKEPTFQNAPNNKVGSTEAENVIFSSETKSRERSFVHSPENMRTSGLIHTNIFSKSLMPPMATVLADGATSEEEAAVSAFQFGSKGLASDAPQHVNTRIDARYCSVQTRETLEERPTSELDKGAFIARTGTRGSSSNPSSSFAVPRFQFGRVGRTFK